MEAFSMAIELYNKPTIKYRVEGFSHFVCNAWELMLKAHMIKTMGAGSIYYKDNPNRTLSLENCIQKVFTNNKDPLRLNLEKIIELRNTSTHFITEEYEMVYVPLFQSCVFNFNEKMMAFHKIDMTLVIPQNFLSLSVSIDAKVKIIKELKDPNVTHKYSMKSCVNEVCARLNRLGIELRHDGEVKKFNSYHFNLFCKYYGIKENPKLCYVHQLTKTYGYSIQTIDFIVEEIKKDPDNIIQNLKNRLIKNKLTPGAKEF